MMRYLYLNDDDGTITIFEYKKEIGSATMIARTRAGTTMEQVRLAISVETLNVYDEPRSCLNMRREIQSRLRAAGLLDEDFEKKGNENE